MDIGPMGKKHNTWLVAYSAGDLTYTDPKLFPVMKRAEIEAIVEEAIEEAIMSSFNTVTEQDIQADKLRWVAREAEYLAHGAWITSGPNNGTVDLPPFGCGCLLTAAGIVVPEWTLGDEPPDEPYLPRPFEELVMVYDDLMRARVPRSTSADGIEYVSSVVRIED